MTIPLTDTTSVLEKIQYIQHMVECNLAPERLDKNDYMCNNCEYKTKCNDWG
jgi:lipopolysaccharide biosynthesis regulator YciM